MPENLDQLAARDTEHVEIAVVGITLEAFLSQQASEFMPRRMLV
jgi:hypothetical protein